MSDDNIRNLPPRYAGNGEHAEYPNKFQAGVHREPTYWLREGGQLIATANPGPLFIITVTPDGRIFLDGEEMGGPGAARWVGCRLIEAAALAEMEVRRDRG